MVLTFAFLLVFLIFLWLFISIEKLGSDDTDSQRDLSSRAFSHIMTLIELTILLIYTYKSRLVHWEYSLFKELLLVSVIYWLQFTANLVYDVVEKPDPDYKQCWGYGFMVIRSALLIFITMIYPLFHITLKHFPLPPSLIIENFKYFLLDGYCLETFDCFVHSLSKKDDFKFGNHLFSSHH